jgi:RimJ/RimL family protein N-acetyltransferase
MRALDTEHLVLRSITPNEPDDLYRILVEEIEGESFTRAAFDAELQFDRYLAQQSLGQAFGRPAIYLKGNNRYIGYCLLMPRLCTAQELSLYSLSPEPTLRHSIEAEMGWAISNQHRGRGYATEAAMALIEYGFRELHLPRILAFTEGSNLASMKVMQKLGMQMGQHPGTGAVVGLIEKAAS